MNISLLIDEFRKALKVMVALKESLDAKKEDLDEDDEEVTISELLDTIPNISISEKEAIFYKG